MSIDLEKKPDDQKDVIAEYANEQQQLDMMTYSTSVKKARTALFVAGALIFIGEMIGMSRTYGQFEPLVFGIAVFEAAIFIALGFWTKKKPYTAIITGIVVFILLVILAPILISVLLYEGQLDLLQSIFSGIIIKVIILVNLISPLKDAKALQEGQKKQF